MPTRKTPQSADQSGRQKVQSELVERGKKTPGVAEAMAAYGSLQRYAPQVGQVAPAVRYATGANR